MRRIRYRRFSHGCCCYPNQLIQLAEEFEIPDKAFLFNTEPDTSTAGLDLDDPLAIVSLEKRILQRKPVLCVVDTVGGTTELSLFKPDEAKIYYAPLRAIALTTGVPFIMATHLNSQEQRSDGGSRACRVVWHLECPDPANYPNRRTFYVKKTEGEKPKPLGLTMTGANACSTRRPRKPRHSQPGADHRRPSSRPWSSSESKSGSRATRSGPRSKPGGWPTRGAKPP